MIDERPDGVAGEANGVEEGRGGVVVQPQAVEERLVRA